MSSDSTKPTTTSDVRKTVSLEAKLHAASKPRMEDRLTRLFKRETDIIAEAKATLESLKSLMPRVKPDGVKDGVEQLGALFDMLMKSRDDIRSECRAMVTGEKISRWCAYRRQQDYRPSSGDGG